MLTQVLIVSGDDRVLSEVAPALRTAGLGVTIGRTPPDLWKGLRHQPPDVLVVDRRMLGPAHKNALAEIRELPDPPDIVVLIAAEDTMARAEFLAGGALATLSRETPTAELARALGTVATRAGEQRLTRVLPPPAAVPTSLAEMRSASTHMSGFLEFVRRIAMADSSLLIEGETGAGKEFFARAIHGASLRHDRPFVPVHCAALSETLLESELFGHVEGAFTGASRHRRGYFELAHTGTVFLDEVGELRPSTQVKLLRVLQERRIQPVGAEKDLGVDVRLMAATNRDLHRDMEEGRFRPDLYYRLSVVTLRVPPLRERVEDIPQMARELVARSAQTMGRHVTGIDEEAMSALVAYGWPGNVRELMNVVERAVLLARTEEVTFDDLPFRSAPARSGGAASTHERLMDEPLAVARGRVVAEFEQVYLRRLMSQAGGRVGTAARRAGMNARSLYEKMKRYGLEKEEFR